MKDPRKEMADVVPYSIFNEGRREKVRLDLNENAWGCSPRVIEVLRDVVPEDISLYPAYEPFIRKIAALNQVEEEQLILSNGADDSIRCVFDAFAEKGDEVIIPVPNYGMFDIYSRIRGVNIVNVLYNDDFSFPTQRLLEKVTKKTKLIIIVNPANPLATAIPENDLFEILKTAKDSIILLDETYYHFINKSYTRFIKDFDNLIIVQTFSKAFGLTGLRLGMTFSQEQNILNLKKVNLPFAVNSLALKAAEAALKDQNFVQQVVENVKLEIEFLRNELEKLGLAVYTGYTNFILMKIGEKSDGIYHQLQRRNVLLRNLGKYPLLKGFLRVSVGKREDNIELIKALKEIMGRANES